MLCNPTSASIRSPSASTAIKYQEGVQGFNSIMNIRKVSTVCYRISSLNVFPCLKQLA